jgi:hypothetical protein
MMSRWFDQKEEAGWPFFQRLAGAWRRPAETTSTCSPTTDPSVEKAPATQETGEQPRDDAASQKTDYRGTHHQEAA